MVGSVENRLSELGITLPEPLKAVANYVPFVQDGSSLYVSGQLPMSEGKLQFTGQVGAAVTLEQGEEAARLCAINILAQVKSALGELDNIDRLIKLTGFVNSGSDFQKHPLVINGASDLMVEVLGDKGRHARSAVGSSSLPFGASVEVEAIFRVAT